MNKKTKRTLIRAFTQGDFEDLKVMMTDIKVMQSTGIRTIKTDTEIETQKIVKRN